VPRALLLGLLSLGVAALLGVGIARSTVPSADASTSPWAALHVPLPPGVRLDENGRLTGLSLVTEPGTTLLTWETLRAHPVGAEGVGELPPEIRALEGRRVTMIGFMLPFYEWTDIRHFALTSTHPSCCFSAPAGLEGTLDVTLQAGHKGLLNTVEPLRAVGTFRVRETREGGWLASVYALDDARVAPLR
jgi:hypothetical protein